MPSEWFQILSGGHLGSYSALMSYGPEKLKKNGRYAISMPVYASESPNSVKTIVENVRTYFQENIHKHISSKGCISWAIQSGNTTRNSSGGYGLPTLIDYIKAVDGELFIFSGNAYYCLENGQNETGEFSNCHFYGTSVTFKVELLKTTNALVFDPVDNCLTSISLENI